jgi:hypothetical protein
MFVPWWGAVILVIAGLEIGYLFGFSIGKEDKYNKDKNN